MTKIKVVNNKGWEKLRKDMKNRNVNVDFVPEQDVLYISNKWLYLKEHDNFYTIFPIGFKKEHWDLEYCNPEGIAFPANHFLRIKFDPSTIGREASLTYHAHNHKLAKGIIFKNSINKVTNDKDIENFIAKQLI